MMLSVGPLICKDNFAALFLEYEAERTVMFTKMTGKFVHKETQYHLGIYKIIVI